MSVALLLNAEKLLLLLSVMLSCLSLLLFDILNGMVSFCFLICLFKPFLVITELPLLKLQSATFLVPWM